MTKFAWANALPDGAMIVNQNGNVVAANNAARDILHISPIGLLATSFIRAPSFSSALQQVRETGEATSADLEFHGRPHRHVNAWLSPLEVDGMLLILLRDLTREQAVEKMRSDFVANASHEMRTPLATIIGSIETLQGAARDDSKAREMFLASMLTQAHRMKRLIDDLLTLSRIELNQHLRPDTKISLAAIALQAKNILSQQALELGIGLELFAEDSVDVFGNSDELLQVALNLIENAIKYGGSGGRVEVSCAVHERNGQLTVKDFGEGISEEHLPRLTERFYRVSTKQSRAQGGTGLGLAIVKHIMLKHRGVLDIRSSQGQGSSFTISIPLYKS